MLLNDTIIRRLANRESLITPFDEDSLQAGSYDLHLDDEIKIPRYPDIVNASQNVTYVDDTKKGFIMQPGQLILASTKEKVNIPEDITAKVEGISSVGRLGLIIQTAGVIDAGFRGHITLELFNASGSQIDLTDFDRIGQLLFYQMPDKAEKPYKGKYQDQDGVTGSRYNKEYDKETVYSQEWNTDMGE